MVLDSCRMDDRHAKISQKEHASSRFEANVCKTNTGTKARDASHPKACLPTDQPFNSLSLSPSLPQMVMVCVSRGKTHSRRETLSPFPPPPLPSFSCSIEAPPGSNCIWVLHSHSQSPCHCHSHCLTLTPSLPHSLTQSLTHSFSHTHSVSLSFPPLSPPFPLSMILSPLLSLPPPLSLPLRLFPALSRRPSSVAPRHSDNPRLPDPARRRYSVSESVPQRFPSGSKVLHAWHQHWALFISKEKWQGRGPIATDDAWRPVLFENPARNTMELIAWPYLCFLILPQLNWSQQLTRPEVDFSVLWYTPNNFLASTLFIDMVSHAMGGSLLVRAGLADADMPARKLLAVGKAG